MGKRKWMKKCMLLGLLSSLLLSGCQMQVDYGDDMEEDYESVDSAKEESVGKEQKAAEEDEKQKRLDQLLEEETAYVLQDYQYDPEKLIKTYENTASEEAVEMAKRISAAVSNAEETVSFAGIASAESFLKQAQELAFLSNPLCESVKSIAHSIEDEYSITYVYDIQTQKEWNDRFIEDVTNVISSVWKKENTEAQNAYAFYRYLIDNFEVIRMDEDTNSERIRKMEHLFQGGGQASLIENYLNRFGSAFDAGRMYMFYLAQIDIDSMFVTGMGQYQKQDIEVLDEPIRKINNSWIWLIVSIEGNTYHCDLGMDLIKCYAMKKNAPDMEYEPEFFGLSDEKRAETFKMNLGRVEGIVGTTLSRSVPTCQEELTGYAN